MAQMIEYLPEKFKALSSNPRTAKKKKKKKKQKGEGSQYLLKKLISIIIDVNVHFKNIFYTQTQTYTHMHCSLSLEYTFHFLRKRQTSNSTFRNTSNVTFPRQVPGFWCVCGG
jgi:hypothetical protein